MLPVTISKGIASSNIVSYLLKGGFFLAVATGTYLILRSVIRKIRRNSITNNFGADTPQARAAQYAANFYTAIFPSGLEWLSDMFGDGTDTALVFSTAQQVHADNNMSEVVKAYRKLYNRDLIIDLQKDLGSSQFAKFNKLVNEGLSGIRMISNNLIAAKPTIVYDEMLKPIGIVRERTCFGGHVESLFQNQGKVLHGFEHKGKMRYVNAEDVNLYSNGH